MQLTDMVPPSGLYPRVPGLNCGLPPLSMGLPRIWPTLGSAWLRLGAVTATDRSWWRSAAACLY